jgi:hypothetical protein
MRMRRLVLVAALLVVPFVFVLPPLLGHWRDPKMSAEATETALQRKLGTSYGFNCTPEENDGSINGLGDVDYVCEADRVSESGYWVGTDESQITGIQAMG